MSVAGFVLLVLACPIALPPRPDCVAIVAEVETVAGCRDLYQEIKAGLPAGMSLGFPECVRGRR
jgi:hypothetical protein